MRTDWNQIPCIADIGFIHSLQMKSELFDAVQSKYLTVPPPPNRTYITVYGLPHKFLAVHHFVPDSQCGFKYILPYSLTLQSYEYIKLWPIYVQCMTVCLCKIRISYQCNFDYKWSRSEKLVLKKWISIPVLLYGIGWNKTSRNFPSDQNDIKQMKAN